MVALTIQGLNNGAADLAHIEELAVSPALTAIDRLGTVKKTMAGVLLDLSAQAAITQTGENRTAAEAARVAAEALVNRWPDITSGLAHTDDGRYFSTPSAIAGESSIVYLRTGVTAYEDARLPDAEQTAALLDVLRTNPQGDSILTVVDEDGAIGFRVASDALDAPFFRLAQTMSATGLILRDEDGFVGAVLGGEMPTEAPLVDPLATRNAENLAAAAAVKSKINTVIQRPVFKYNVKIIYGQSLSTGNEGWPALSKAARFPNDVFMLGLSTRPANVSPVRDDPHWEPVGSAMLNPMRAVTQSNAPGSPLMTDAQVAAIVAPADNDGESYEHGAANMWRKQFLQWHCLDSDPNRKLVVMSCGVGGRTIEQLSKGAEPHLYNRVIEACQAIKDWVAENDPGASVGLVMVEYEGNQFNYNGAGGGTADKSTFKALMKTLFSNIIQDCAYGIFGQNAPPAFFYTQTDGVFTVDATLLSIGMAQIELANENPNFILTTPTYPYPDKGGHLDSNGYRWVGNQLGKIQHRVVDRGEAWQPLKPLRATYSGKTVSIDMLVPVPPLQFRVAYQRSTATMYPSRGFGATDTVGEIEIISVEIVASTIVQLTLARESIGDLIIWYARRGTDGSGNLFDSDDTVAIDRYEYSPGTGQYLESNIVDLVNSPYPLQNPCVAFRIAAQTL